MHELSLAQGIIDAVLVEADNNKAKRVAEMDVDVGELMQLDMKALSDALRLLLRGPRLEGAKVRVRSSAASFSCRKCEHRWNMAEAKEQLAHVPQGLLVQEPDSRELPLHFLPYLYSAFIHCPECGSSDISAEGEEVRLRRIVLK